MSPRFSYFLDSTHSPVLQIINENLVCGKKLYILPFTSSIPPWFLTGQLTQITSCASLFVIGTQETLK